MIGWELDCPALDALGDAANTGQHVAPHRCRVRACRVLLLHGGVLCVDHNTAAIRAMKWPHQYVFNDEVIVLESQPWEDDEPAGGARRHTAGLRATS